MLAGWGWLSKNGRGKYISFVSFVKLGDAIETNKYIRCALESGTQTTGYLYP